MSAKGSTQLFRQHGVVILICTVNRCSLRALAARLRHGRALERYRCGCSESGPKVPDGAEKRAVKIGITDIPGIVQRNNAVSLYLALSKTRCPSSVDASGLVPDMTARSSGVSTCARDKAQQSHQPMDQSVSDLHIEFVALQSTALAERIRNASWKPCGRHHRVDA